MNRSFYLFFAALSVCMFLFASCKESEGIDQYADWKVRNESYLKFISDQAKANLGNEVGKWKIIKSYKQNPDIEGTTSDINNYVYARINQKGTGANTPLYTDSIKYYYRGMLINGYLFDHSKGFVPEKSLSQTDTIFAGKPADAYGDLFSHVVYFPDIDILSPSKTTVSGLINGWITTLQEMKAGDYWTVYIPAPLGYGSASDLAIPANSLLIFDLYLQEVYY